ncbi:hypothetical protein [Paenibacillus popilliae]|nr:hypothetical protein [Paenibacillus popilliae]
MEAGQAPLGAAEAGRPCGRLRLPARWTGSALPQDQQSHLPQAQRLG